ncbi:MAG: integration host factor, actinobacterial type [bacterium]|nr:integration host factor, actinobacterial type [bacterium]
MAGPPQLTAEQRQAALAKAGEVRRKRAEVKQKLKMRSISLSDLLAQAETDDVVAGTKVLAVLESLPGMGKVRARRMMDEIGIADSRRIRGLGDQQRASLLARCGD